MKTVHLLYSLTLCENKSVLKNHHCVYDAALENIAHYQWIAIHKWISTALSSSLVYFGVYVFLIVTIMIFSQFLQNTIDYNLRTRWTCPDHRPKLGLLRVFFWICVSSPGTFATSLTRLGLFSDLHIPITHCCLGQIKSLWILADLNVLSLFLKNFIFMSA